MKLNIVDLQTGEYPKVQEIVLSEGWARRLIYCDIDGFYLGEDGELILVDDCNNVAICPSGRFKVTVESEE